MKQLGSSNGVGEYASRDWGTFPVDQHPQLSLSNTNGVAKGKDPPSVISINIPFASPPTPHGGQKATETFSQSVGGNVLWKIIK